MNVSPTWRQPSRESRIRFRQQVRKNALQHLNQENTFTRKQGSFTLERLLDLGR